MNVISIKIIDSVTPTQKDKQNAQLTGGTSTALIKVLAKLYLYLNPSSIEKV